MASLHSCGKSVGTRSSGPCSQREEQTDKSRRNQNKRWSDKSRHPLSQSDRSEHLVPQKRFAFAVGLPCKAKVSAAHCWLSRAIPRSAFLTEPFRGAQMRVIWGVIYSRKCVWYR
ncbi:hypothetical protein CDAR_64941 [Caerostris darwini]|uniref:Uncharacterized protein n=1 Tax=Caerostris darwini TaxID=1538125 RepID=A0AAV4VZN3_9ARAC|nr:hypothetical protein CDAR_64941 [Caerostris darwini]